MSHPVPDHPEYRRDQRPDILQRCQHGQQQHRAGLDHDVPAEHKRLDLKRPGGEQIGRPLKAVVADAEWRERGSPRRFLQDARSLQDSMTRFTTCLPFSLFFLGKLPGWPQSSAGDTCVNPDRGMPEERSCGLRLKARYGRASARASVIVRDEIFSGVHRTCSQKPSLFGFHHDAERTMTKMTFVAAALVAAAAYSTEASAARSNAASRQAQPAT